MSEYKPKLTDDMIEAYRRKKNIREDSAYGFYIGVDFAREFYEDNYMKSESTEETNVESSKYKPFNLEECLTKYGGHCVTNAGEAVEILKTDLNGVNSVYPVLALVTDEYGRQMTRAYTAKGNYTAEENGHTHQQSLRLLVGTEDRRITMRCDHCNKEFDTSNEDTEVYVVAMHMLTVKQYVSNSRDGGLIAEGTYCKSCAIGLKDILEQ
jgi:hypothetical protein